MGKIAAKFKSGMGTIGSMASAAFPIHKLVEDAQFFANNPDPIVRQRGLRSLSAMSLASALGAVPGTALTTYLLTQLGDSDDPAVIDAVSRMPYQPPSASVF